MLCVTVSNHMYVASMYAQTTRPYHCIHVVILIVTVHTLLHVSCKCGEDYICVLMNVLFHPLGTGELLQVRMYVAQLQVPTYVQAHYNLQKWYILANTLILS